MKNLLVAVDFSKFTTAVLAEAARLSAALNAKLWILHVASNEAQTLVLSRVALRIWPMTIFTAVSERCFACRPSE